MITEQYDLSKANHTPSPPLPSHLPLGTSKGTRGIDCACRRVSSTFVETRPPATFAPASHCWPTFLPCMPSTMGTRASRR